MNVTGVSPAIARRPSSRGLPRRPEAGASITEAMVVLCVLVTLGASAYPSGSAALDEGRARHAAAFAAARLREARQQAITRSAVTGLVFDVSGDRWVFRLCIDRNANGLRRADLRLGRDTCSDGQVDLAELFPGVRVAVDETIRGPEGEPPSSDPVRFGSSEVASFSPVGTCTAGSLFLQSAKGTQFVVRVAGTTGRLRVLRYDATARTWREQ